LKTGAFLPTAALLPAAAFASAPSFNPRAAEQWRSFEVTTHVQLLDASGVSRVWIPLPSVNESWQRSIGNSWSGSASRAMIVSDGTYGAQMLYAEFKPGQADAVVELKSRFATRDRGVNLSRPGNAPQLSASDRAFYTRPTEMLPTDGIVRRTAVEATKAARTDVEKAHAIYEWVVVNTFRDAKTRGCGIGDIKGMLESGNFGGKCADLNALYVGLARSVGLPARDMYGIRVAQSQFGYRSLGAGSPNITKAQHCRAEVYLDSHGWVPVDPADVRKVALEEKSQPVPIDDPAVQAVRPKLFGAWEMNWLAYNDAHDVLLPFSDAYKLPFLMYPQAETAAGRIDSLDSDNFRYSISARELSA
jgi:transglutaminase-like putative cysteine protease